MRKGKKVIVIILAVLTALMDIVSFEVMARHNSSPKQAVLIIKSTSVNFEFWQVVKQGAELACKEENINLEVKGPMYERDVQEQKAILKSTIAEKPDIILLAATDVNELTPLVKEAQDNGIVVVTVDSAVDSDRFVGHVGTDNVTAAKALTKCMASLIGEEGDVIMVNTVSGCATAREREEGYKEQLKQYPKIKVYPTAYSEGTIEGAYIATRKLLQKYPHLKAIVGANQQTTDGICQALEQIHLDHPVKIVGFDSSDTIVYALEKNEVQAIVVQKPFNMGYLSVKKALSIYKGEKVPQFTNTGYKFIDKTSLYYTENQKLLYPIIK